MPKSAQIPGNKRSTCRVCYHHNRSLIELALAEGQSASQVARDHELTKWAVSRHWKNHVPDAHKRAIALGGSVITLDIEALRKQMRKNVLPDLLDLRARTWALLDQAQAKGNIPLATALIARGQTLTDLIDEKTDKLKRDSQALGNAINMEIYLRLRHGLIGALKPHPKARDSVLEFLSSFDDRMAALSDGAPIIEVLPEAVNG